MSRFVLARMLRRLGVRGLGFPLAGKRAVPAAIRIHREIFGKYCPIVVTAERYRCEEHGYLPIPRPTFYAVVFKRRQRSAS